MTPKSNENIGQMLKDRVSRRPEKPFLFSEIDGREWTYSEFERAVHRSANLLLASGITKGDVVSLLLPNSAEYIIAYFACFKIGAIAGPVNSLLNKNEIDWVVGNSEAKLMLTSTELSSKIPLQENSPMPTIIFDDHSEATNEYSEEIKPVDLNPDDAAVIVYTSGTTGKPKGCILTHGNLTANARQITEWMGFTDGDRLLTVMPLFHMNAVSVTTMTALYAGASTVISPKFSASRFWDIIEKYQITSFGSVATMLSMLLQNPRSSVPCPKTLRFAMCGSAPVPAEILKRFEEKFSCLVIEGYGLSESTCRSTFNPPNNTRRPGSCGLPIGNEMKVVNENDNEVVDSELGEIVIRGENIFKEYFKNPEATAMAFSNGWFHTGDIGYRDADGFFYIADRKSDMIIRGGENIYPREIDDLLYTHQAVAAAAVIGVPDEIYGEEVAAFVVLKNGEVTTADQLIDFCRQNLAEFKCPKTVHFLKDIPKGPTGKLLKRELTKLLQKAAL
ncbi:MAG: long-chain-fatty-acid--CoA ligase [Pyrinomonadaceae bacterium]